MQQFRYYYDIDVFLFVRIYDLNILSMYFLHGLLHKGLVFRKLIGFLLLFVQIFIEIV